MRIEIKNNVPKVFLTIRDQNELNNTIVLCDQLGHWINLEAASVAAAALREVQIALADVERTLEQCKT